MKKLLKKILPPKLILQYHKFLGRYAAKKFDHPSNKLIVIGVTGTKGKSTTCNLIWHLLTQAGFKVGMATTVNFRIADKHWLNDTKMTMLGRTKLQNMLSDMVEAGCQYAIIETSSEGIKQFRHIGINYDMVVFTNLYPEHLDAHEGFENYKQAKLELFRHASQSLLKEHDGKTIQKIAVVNADATDADQFIQAAQMGSKIIWSRKENVEAPINLQISSVVETAEGVKFSIGEYEFNCNLHGAWNVENIVSAVSVCIAQGFSYPDIVAWLNNFPGVPGRMELIDAGQKFFVVVDYAYEPTSLGLLYDYWRKQVGLDKKMITLISSTGGGRDVGRRATNGQVAAEKCDYVIVTDEDPYDDDPQEIIDQVAAGALAVGKVENQNMWRILDRTEAIVKACSLALPGDVVFLTAKGAEQKMCVAKGKKIDWDDRKVVYRVIKQILGEKAT
ncbi:MAG: UDP-N-acetylmuramyl-tripeptide synthetase [bacterium]|nr:UDP-N-acetylmuramyl-tripeptide synthetase [bacterium]